MSNLLDMIEEGETDLPEVDTSPKKNPNSIPEENVVLPSSGQSVAGSKVFKDINLPVAKSVVFEIKSGMNTLLDVLRNHDYSGTDFILSGHDHIIWSVIYGPYHMVHLIKCHCRL